MLLRVSSPAVAGIAAFLAAALAPTLASAYDVTGSETKQGELTYKTLTVKSGGVLKVAPASVGGGKITITANSIVVEAGGQIIADGAGYVGAKDAAGQGPAGANGGGQRGPNPNEPGGGGACVGAGAQGLLADCTTAGGAGGVPYFSGTTEVWGAAGGAANTTSPGNSGGAGGGVIILRAGKIQIDGIVSARGESPLATVGSGVGRGGGAGGTITLLAGSLLGSGTIDVRGGDGSGGTSNGGGGGGGALILYLPSKGTPPSSLAVKLDGGATGACTGAPGQIGQQLTPGLQGTCPDLDGDGVPSDQCGGTDCDDTDPAQSPNEPEICDGKDQNCNGEIDESPTDCEKGTECKDAKCVKVAVDAGSDAGALPDHLEFGGGCSLPQTGGLAEGALGAAAFAAGVMALAASRRRRRR